MQSSSSSQEPRDRVTIGFYGNEILWGASLDNAIKELGNINTINRKFSEAARAAGRKPPEIVISLLLVPNWREKSNYENVDYLNKKYAYIALLKEAVKNKIKIEGDESVAVQDFYKDGNLDDAEKEYLKNLVAIGSTADMIKTHAIICDDNIIRRHLQMDSNTKIYDFELLYNETFGRSEQTDALNACYYDKIYRYVSAHNKIVYTTVYTPVQSPLALTLRDVHIQYCREHQKDHTDPNDPIKIAEKKVKNSIYSKDFVVALEQRGLVRKKTLRSQTGSSQVIYRALLNKKDAYRITQCVATAVNMSWAAADDPLADMIKAAEKEFKALPSVEVLDATCDYTCFANAVLKHAGLLTNHGDDPSDEPQAHRELLEISSPHEKKMIKAFVDKVRDEKPDMLEKLIGTILFYGERGEKLFMDVFKCDPSEYKEKVDYKKNTPGIK